MNIYSTKSSIYDNTISFEQYNFVDWIQENVKYYHTRLVKKIKLIFSKGKTGICEFKKLLNNIFDLKDIKQ
ncbi:hypothetical protein [Clostridium hydrogenum]|uniref:hypothetical protein n=1 Tax=Clostridium hydrogenum TaxID=2855764 RepID=UPI001F26C85D|nr:hypothetical protein [Clostridium hydrogenum]